MNRGVNLMLLTAYAKQRGVRRLRLGCTNGQVDRVLGAPGWVLVEANLSESSLPGDLANRGPLATRFDRPVNGERGTG
jgi:hypothetical protein